MSASSGMNNEPTTRPADLITMFASSIVPGDVICEPDDRGYLVLARGRPCAPGYVGWQLRQYGANTSSFEHYVPEDTLISLHEFGETE